MPTVPRSVPTVPVCLLFLCAYYSTVPLCISFVCSSVSPAPLCLQFVGAYCSSVPSAPLCLVFLCSSVPLCLLFLCAHCSSVPTVPPGPLFPSTWRHWCVLHRTIRGYVRLSISVAWLSVAYVTFAVGWTWASNNACECWHWTKWCLIHGKVKLRLLRLT